MWATSTTSVCTAHCAGSCAARRYCAATCASRPRRRTHATASSSRSASRRRTCARSPRTRTGTARATSRPGSAATQVPLVRAALQPAQDITRGTRHALRRARKALRGPGGDGVPRDGVQHAAREHRHECLLTHVQRRVRPALARGLPRADAGSGGHRRGLRPERWEYRAQDGSRPATT